PRTTGEDRCATGPAGPARARSRRRSCRRATAATRSSAQTPSSSAAPRPATGFVQLCVDAARDLCRHARNALELIGRRGEHRVDRAEVVKERPPPRRADALELVEQRGEAARLAPLPVEADGEAVRLVADPLQAVEA